MTAGTKRRSMLKPVVRWSTESSRDSRLAVRDSSPDSFCGLCALVEPRTANCEPRESDINLLVLSEDAAQRVGDLAEGCSCFHRADHQRDQIRRVARGRCQPVQRRLPLASVARRSNSPDSLDLAALDLWINPKHVNVRRLLGDETIDADHH